MKQWKTSRTTLFIKNIYNRNLTENFQKKNTIQRFTTLLHMALNSEIHHVKRSATQSKGSVNASSRQLIKFGASAHRLVLNIVS